MYHIIIPNSVKKDLQKLDKRLIKLIISQLKKLAIDPYLGTRLSGFFSYLFKINLRKRKTEYRIVYAIFEDKLEVHVIHIGTRENFYRELKRRL